ncbi:acyl-CoA dehydrogenase family protein [Streptomyces sp. GC420]|uniref:acyl-CoA dehydrogenase family protein n=1 Tax=Streptomyces sp. GC420 TaxID=2697568 RepID=UPI001414E072|nr:acyl-CoA dehydrogenase family protein [Streptomyces sp. GC420]NBM14721.1 acyl-CoA dehydrogenase [Streptomyces sp. GC420]
MANGSGPEPVIQELRARTADFVRDVAEPAEAAMLSGTGAPDDRLRRALQQRARAAGIFAPTAPRALGGLGLDLCGQSVVLETAGRSLLGPLALNCAAPDEGNMHLLARTATPDQRRRYLEPLVEGAVRSCFAMTEPAPGAGSDPSQLATRARRARGGWVIDGRKWFVTGADGAAFALVMARTDRGGGEPEATVFLVPTGTPGFEVVRHIPTLDSGFTGGHCEIALTNCAVGDDAVLGHAVGQGFAQAQLRLEPARLTHSMRWLGLAARAHETAVRYTCGRTAFGSRLGDLGMVQQQIADNEIDLAAGRALVREAAQVLDSGLPGRQETSVAKTFVAEAVGRVVDRAVQMCGASGLSGELPLAAYLREVRAFRVYDGPSEVHRRSIARRAVRRHGAPDGRPAESAPTTDTDGAGQVSSGGRA